jgi:uncharacterized protein YgiM (DUF1202 family)
MADESKGFWAGIPGMLTGLAAVISAVTGLYALWAKDVPVTKESTAEPLAPLAQVAAVAPSVPALHDPFILSAVISDPDGFTNVRSTPAANGQVVVKLQAGEVFRTFRQDGSWWQVKTPAGRVGYVHVSRIQLKSDQ